MVRGMDDQNRARLSRMVTRWGRERAALSLEDADRKREREAAFHEALGRVFATVVRPVIEDIRAELRSGGHDCRVDERGSEGSRRLDLHLVVQGRSGSKDLVQFLVRTYPERGPELIVELVLKSSPFELGRFPSPAELTADVAEHMLVGAIEQIFASPAS
jgi:hypothetical protein